MEQKQFVQILLRYRVVIAAIREHRNYAYVDLAKLFLYNHNLFYRAIDNSL